MPIKCATKTGYQMAQVGDSIDLSYATVNSRRGRVVWMPVSIPPEPREKNVLSIMYSKEDILFAALKVNPARIDSYRQAAEEPIFEETVFCAVRVWIN